MGIKGLERDYRKTNKQEDALKETQLNRAMMFQTCWSVTFEMIELSRRVIYLEK